MAKKKESAEATQPLRSPSPSSSKRQPPSFGVQIGQIICATLPLLALFIYLLYEASQRLDTSDPCNRYDQDYDDGVIPDDCGTHIRLIDMMILFFVVCILWTTLAAYLSFYIPRRHDLLRMYLEEGKSLLGDVFYEKRLICGGVCGMKDHIGHLTYKHPNYKVYPVYVRREVTVAKRYTREMTTIIVLKDKPYSGMPKADLEVDHMSGIKTRPKRHAIATVCWVWAAFTGLAPIYLIHVYNRVHLQDDFDWATLSWILYSIVIAIVIPVIAWAANTFSFNRYLHHMTQDGRIAEEGEEEDGSGRGWLDGVEEADRIYIPPRKTGEDSGDEYDETTLMAS